MRYVHLLGGLVCLLAASTAYAQDPVKVDPAHYKVTFENAQVRVLKVHYGPHEKSPMHSHPDAVRVFLTDSHVKLTSPDGKTSEQSAKAGDARWGKAVTHLSENLGDKPQEIILVELKSSPKPAKAAAAAKK